MVERFLYGIDVELESNLIRFLRRSSAKVAKAVQDAGVDVSSLGIDSQSYAGEVEKFLDRLKRRSRDETYDMVDFMPKQELAYTAEAFVTLTSIKRKVSNQQETVGGPIDVALITRNEGFVWIKRKHYFSIDMNPGYNVRAFERGGRNDNANAP